MTPSPRTDATTTPAPSTTADLLELLDAAATQCREHGRADLVDKLARQRRQLTSGTWHVLVAGEFKKGKSALVNGLVGVPVCGVDPVAFTAVPTLVRHGQTATAELMPDGEQYQPRPIDIRDAAAHGLSGVAGGDPAGALRLRAVEVSLPRQLLAAGLVLVDTPGLGGGFAAAAAAASMRALSLADAVIVVTDASQELTAAEVEFVRNATKLCPNLLCVLTKTDLYPQWRQIQELDRGHLRAAGLDVEVVAVSSTLRELALDTGDQALNAESGFPVLVERLCGRLLAPRQATSLQAAVTAVRRSLQQVAGTLAAEHTALTKPAERTETLRRVETTQQRTQHLASPSSRWLNTISDRFADIGSMVEADLAERIRRLESEASDRVRAGDPTRDWAQLVPWLYRRANEELTDTHAKLITKINDLAAEVAALFEANAGAVDALGGSAEPPKASEQLKLDHLGRRAGKLEVGMQAARGWSLSSSVVTTLLITTLNPGLLIALPVTAALGTVFAIKAVRSYRTARLDTARNEALRTIAGYLNQARIDAHRASADLIRHSRSRIRDYYLDQAAELVSAARHAQQAAVTAASTATADERAAATRGAATQAKLERVSTLLATADRLGANGGSAAT